MCAFDLLKLDKVDLRRLPLMVPKQKLRKLLARTRDGIQLLKQVGIDGDAAFKAACDLGLEGIVSNAADGALQVRAVQELDQGPQSEVSGVPADHRGDILSAVVT